ncbi:hypothetical protein SS50377_23710 [Spironucleus salmonicida]|uniref:Uncharacterized protein n=1 Tax=Spironucleus salmonicida TaxID=348837 RepID=V6LVP4_9EUKA|nr:hypothetical protein SS50377_23710 [Spironucleus salmonicida]|eukprot:EST48692.1 Hypothetical protein SS50377_11305 [Spironucleus salmonicida]
MSDFDSTDFDSESSEHQQQQATTKQITSKQPTQGNFEYPPYIMLSSFKTTFQQNEMTYKQKIINLVNREQFTTMQSGHVQRGIQTYQETKSLDVEIQAPVSEPRSSFNLVMDILQQNTIHLSNEQTRTKKYLRAFTLEDTTLITLETADFPITSHSPSSTFNYNNSTNTISSFLIHQTTLKAVRNATIFTFPNHFQITDITISNGNIFASTTSGSILILQIPTLSFTALPTSNSFLSHVAALGNQALALSPDGTLRKFTLSSIEVIDKNINFRSLCSCVGWCFLGFQSETGICQDFDMIKSKGMRMISGRVHDAFSVDKNIKMIFADGHFEVWSNNLEVCVSVGSE